MKLDNLLIMKSKRLLMADTRRSSLSSRHKKDAKAS